MEPSFKIKDKQMFYKYLNKCKIYFEYGSGGSTYQASIRYNITKIFSVESDKEWLNFLKQKITSKNVIHLFNEMNVQPKTWGHPGPNSTQAQHINYSNHIRNLTLEEQKSINLILIDGRFRVACCLKCFDIINQDCLIVFNDFLDRPTYHVVLDYYDIINNTTDNSMVILKKKKGIECIPEELIKQYELIAT
jgi:protein O-GlcNAc transferase